TQDAAKIIFTGTLSPTIDPATQQWIDMVTLHTSVGPQTIQYNVTVQDGKFQDTASGEILYQSEGADPWVIQFYVNLALQSSTFEELPTEVQTEVQNLSASGFSFQQLYADLNTAALASFVGIAGLDPTSSAATNMVGVLKEYLLLQQTQAQMMFGYAATNPQSTQQST